jgi:rubrerythrin
MSDDDPTARTIVGARCHACGQVVRFAELTSIGYLPRGYVFEQTPCPRCGHVQNFADSRLLEEMGRQVMTTKAFGSPPCDKCGQRAAEGHYRQVLNHLENFELDGPFLVWFCRRCLHEIEGGE